MKRLNEVIAKILVLSIVGIIPLTSMGQTNFDVYFLGGQSNMDGYGYVKELPDSLKKKSKNVYIFHLFLDINRARIEIKSINTISIL